ncbi:MAG: DUF86 domain-containing protein [Acidimicrobiales bacterium]|nr:DUF86 domain-containing protein [Acidimicrobiales bacterium]
MSRSDDERIADIVEAAEQISIVVARGRDAWNADRFAQLAVERLLEIVGESARAMTEVARARHPAVPWTDIIGLRTVLAHHYHRVDPAQVWSIASIEIPKLAANLVEVT